MFVPRSVDCSRSSFGDASLNSAIAAINQVQQKAMTTMTHFTPNRAEVISMLFRDDDIEKLRAVHGMVVASDRVKAYSLSGQGVYLNIDYVNCQHPAVEESRLYYQMQGDRMQPLYEHILHMRAVHDRYEELKGLLRWLNRNATPGAIRFLFPQAMKLVSDSPIWKDLQEVPSRYSQPPRISEWTQVMRDAANTYASMALLPTDATIRPRQHMWLTFGSRKVELSEHSSYQTDLIIYNL
jgi:hypothetical protein